MANGDDTQEARVAQQIREAAEFLEGYDAPWWFAGGRAIDLAQGRAVRRRHGIEVAVLRADQARLRERLAGFRVTAVVGGMTIPWEPGETLSPAVTEVRARHPERFPRPLRFFLQKSHAGLWFHHRKPVITRPLSALGGVTKDGLPHLAPEVVLLDMAAATGPEDEQDFAAALPALSGQARLWLARALRAGYPGHPWIERLSPPRPPVAEEE
jgi:hypothetical protein